ncbi:hypothetical protein [Haloarcula sp. JP-L23]|uniref:hypothetical protein n=1 Tax=Haloarcula sp. JP-L23 TaxID=2716717 RepID=UPI00140F002C|nr:hypothetical protein G9465_23760 [Haloarcula sp. JP-L23]
MDDEWADYQQIASPADGRYDWTGILTQRADLKQELASYAESPPALFSFFAVRATFPENLRSVEAQTSVDVTGGGVVPLRVDRVGEWIKENTCGRDPHHSEVRTFARELFIDLVGSRHRIEPDPSVEDGLRKDISPSCMNTRSYSKTRYLNYQYTLESEWEAGDSDEIGDIDFKGYLSIENAKSEYLLVGGMVPDEEVSTELVGGNIVGDEAELATTLVRLMEQTTLKE